MDRITRDWTPARHRALAVFAECGRAYLSNTTDARIHRVDWRPFVWLAEKGLIRQPGVSPERSPDPRYWQRGQITRLGVVAAEERGLVVFAYARRLANTDTIVSSR